MKKVIKANRYKDKANKHAENLAYTARALADAIEAVNDQQLAEAVSGMGKFYQNLSRREVIDGLLRQLTHYGDEYLELYDIDANYDDNRDEILDFLEDKGYPIQRYTGKQDPIYSGEAYIIVPSDDAEFDDLNKVCKQISDYFGVKWDTPLSGSWTGHSTEYEGVKFEVCFARDYDVDPTGHQSALMIIF